MYNHGLSQSSDQHHSRKKKDGEHIFIDYLKHDVFKVPTIHHKQSVNEFTNEHWILQIQSRNKSASFNICLKK